MNDSKNKAVKTLLPYEAPLLSELGDISAVTSGPNTGALDQLGGASGGFITPPPTS